MSKKRRPDDAAREGARDWSAPPDVRSERVVGDRRLVTPTLGALDALDVDSIVCGWCSDVRPLAGALGMLDWRLCGRVSRLLESGAITCAADEKVLMPTLGRVPVPRVFVYGFGPSTSLSTTASAKIAAMAQMVKKAGGVRVAVALPEPCQNVVDALVEVVHAEFGDVATVVFAPDPFPPV